MKNILIIGAGIVGICTSIELIKKGYYVTLMDPNEPGSQTSYGNAGVITDSSLMIINNPQLLKSLFSLRIASEKTPEICSPVLSSIVPILSEAISF